jgi:nucleoside triphosphate pyrophosphatase
MMTDLLLASASPRRKALLEQLGVLFDIYAVDIDETPCNNELPVDYVQRIAKTKAFEAWQQLKTSNDLLEVESLIILAMDTSVTLDNRIFGKPVNKSDFTNMMAQLSGNEHEVMTSVCALEVVSSEVISEHVFSVLTKVKFKTLDSIEIQAYWQTGEPKDKAGGYGIQGKGAVFIERIEGSYSNVVGLPLKETSELLTHLGMNIWSS